MHKQLLTYRSLNIHMIYAHIATYVYMRPDFGKHAVPNDTCTFVISIISFVQINVIASFNFEPEVSGFSKSTITFHVQGNTVGTSLTCRTQSQHIMVYHIHKHTSSHNNNTYDMYKTIT